jgi:hypothetical protein
LNYGFNASLNLFDGLAQNRKIATIQIETAAAKLNSKFSIKSQLTTAYQTYLTNLELIQLEDKNEASQTKFRDYLE